MTKRVRNFCITVNNYGKSDIDSITSISIVQYAIIGREVGENGTPHLQGYLQLNKPQTTSALQKKLKKVGVKASLLYANGSPIQNKNYCIKDGDFVEYGVMKAQGKRNDINAMYQSIKDGKTDVELQEEHTVAYTKYYKAVDRIRYNIKQDKAVKSLKEQYKEVNLRLWQIEALAKLDAQNDRQILWVHDAEGNKGKTWLAKYLISQRNAFYVRGGKSKDVSYAYNYEDTVVFDFTRSQEEYINYSVIESFKDGLLFSPKYESTTKKFGHCKVIVFSNFEPDTSTLSQDRWVIMTL